MARGSPGAFRCGERGIHRVRHGVHLCRAGRRTRRAPHTDTPFLTRPSCSAPALPQLLQYLDYMTGNTLSFHPHHPMGSAPRFRTPSRRRREVATFAEGPRGQTRNRRPDQHAAPARARRAQDRRRRPRAVKHFGPAPLIRVTPGRSKGGGWGIRTPEGLHPTRFPSVRHRPLGESSSTHRSALDHPKR